MADDASHQLARQVVARLCQPLGWQGIQSGACDVLADLMKRYIVALGKSTATYAGNANRTDPAPEDVAYAFKDMGFSFDDLATYARLVDTSTLPSLPQFPLPRHSSHIYSPPSTPITRPRPSLSLSKEEEDDIIPPFFPPLPTKKTDDDKDDTESGVHDSVDHDELLDVTDPLVTPGDPTRGLPQLYRSRSRLSSDISEEGGEGGSRRSSFSDTSVGIPAIIRSAEANISRITSLTTAPSDVGTQPRPKTPVDKNNSTQVLNRQGSRSSGKATPMRTVDDDPMKTMSVPSNNLAVEELSDRQGIADPCVHIEKDVTQEEGEGEGGGASEAVTVSSRPPPLRLMSTGGSDQLPVMSPILSSPGSASQVGVVNTSLPLLSPLCTTPTLSHAPLQVSKATVAKVAVATGPQLTPTATHSLSLSSQTSPHPPLPVDTQINKHGPTTSTATPQTPPHESPPELQNTHTRTCLSSGPEIPHELQEQAEPLSSSESPSEVVVSGEATGTIAAAVMKVKLKEDGEDSDEVLSPEVATSPVAISPSHATSSETKERSFEDKNEQSTAPLHTTSPSPPPPSPPSPLSPPETHPASIKPVDEEGEDEKQDNDSVLSSGSSKQSSPEPTHTPEQKNGFSDLSTNENPTEIRMLGMVTDINMEEGGEGGVASIIHGGEEDMDLPDIDKQLEMSESEEVSTSSSSGSEEEAVLTSHQTQDILHSKELARRGEFLQPPHPSSVRSSSYSLASTPSVSPSPSPIPPFSPCQNPVPVSGSDVTPVPYLKSPHAQKMKERGETAKPLIVRFKRNLITTFGEGKEGEGGGGVKRAKVRQQKPPLSSSLAKAPPTKPKKRSVATPPTLPHIVVEPPSGTSLVISIQRCQLQKSFGLTSEPQSQTGFTFSNEEDDDDDIIVTHSSAQQVKLKPPSERVKTEISIPSGKSSMERVNVPSSSKRWASSHSPAPSDIAQYPAMAEGQGGMGVWRRELDISEMGLLPPAPPDQQVKIIPQSSSSSSSSGETDSDSDSSSPSPLPTSHPHTLPPTHSQTPSPWQYPVKSEDEESTSSSATAGSGGLKLKLKISKALLQNVAPPPKPEKKGRKRGPAAGVSMATTSRGKRGRPSKKSQKRNGSNIPQIKLPKIKLPTLPGALPRRQTTPLSETSRSVPAIRLTAAVAVSPSGEVWYCPHCTKPDDGSPMIGCDGPCEGWYHWYCVGIAQAPPENERWFCPSCARGKKKSRKRRN